LRLRSDIVLAVLAVTLAPLGVAAQTPACQFRGAPDALRDRPSPLDSLVVRLGNDEAKLCYGSPSAGGIPRIGADIPYGTPWQMGANEPTTLHVTFPARLGTVDLAPGSYSLYAIPEAGDWTIVVNGNPNRWGTPITADVRAADIGSFSLRPTTLSTFVDRLTFRFEPSGSTGGSLIYSWGRTALAIPLARR
jgi:Protein of unknown function (DUF2911)